MLSTISSIELSINLLFAGIFYWISFERIAGDCLLGEQINLSVIMHLF
jgi:hypothetical protein